MLKLFLITIMIIILLFKKSYDSEVKEELRKIRQNLGDIKIDIKDLITK